MSVLIAFVILFTSIALFAAAGPVQAEQGSRSFDPGTKAMLLRLIDRAPPRTNLSRRLERCLQGRSGFLDQCAAAATILSRGVVGMPADARSADRLWRAMCKLGSPRGCAAVAFLHEEAGRFAQAVALYQKTCAQGELASCQNLGCMYDDGRGVKGDRAKARAYFTKTCEAGDELGCARLAHHHWRGHGVPVDLERALELFRTACSKGHNGACINVNAVERDIREAKSQGDASTGEAKGR